MDVFNLSYMDLNNLTEEKIDEMAGNWSIREWANSEPDLRRQYLTYYIMGIGGMAVCCLGIIGNILSIVVLTQKCMNSSTYSYLTSLAVCDLLFLLFSMIILVKDTEKPPHNHLFNSNHNLLVYFSKYSFMYVHPIAFTLQVISIWLTLAVTVDRYILVCHSHKAERFCNVSRARKVIAGIYLLGVLYNIPKFFEYGTTYSKEEGQELTLVGSKVTEFGRSELFRLLFHSWLYLIFIYIIPFMALAILNTFLKIAVAKSLKRGGQFSICTLDRKSYNTTVMLIGVVVIFFLCQTPALISHMIWAFKPTVMFTSVSCYALNEVGSLFVIMNSSINIVPYFFFCKSLEFY